MGAGSRTKKNGGDAVIERGESWLLELKVERNDWDIEPCAFRATNATKYLGDKWKTTNQA